ncbi:MAG: hypothetical protein A3B74_03065 [Candidatus Kerfeldbacteria bacterium RIFCSPHIGHO2_02_FULL_42_14]|uniref:Uncharacterized protein n=1 Tax=Candidatus Kerfeldbacteria bacterium RIFCSPHIGHO2_02_FULL_42_14 TaxID=1798540 RepID=A0A1G2ARX3_9BACT|nr:MAG: hypothetical protein A3B74_03065 [Candidatus Kerfeldbacteria bacterium RIFCSPHIGHO2_02_FULL_42_14]OGY84124.1 MAG: hypothetical protein A3I91_01375 [Candidatus Kerfeldbacteria bacterium RIFCSPLOWO2_02_FULL_42_19]
MLLTVLSYELMSGDLWKPSAEYLQELRAREAAEAEAKERREVATKKDVAPDARRTSAEIPYSWIGFNS